MKITHGGVSGTGNGVRDNAQDDFVVALRDFEKLIRRIHKYLDANRDKWFSRGAFYVLNNWHNMYKIDLRNDEFPYHLCNGIAVYDGGWNTLQLVVKFPLRFKAPTFGGGETQNMSVALVTEHSLSQDGIDDLLSSDHVPEHLKDEILKRVLSETEDRLLTEYKKDIEHMREIAQERHIEIEQAQKDVEMYNIAIPQLEERAQKLTEIIKAR